MMRSILVFLVVLLVLWGGAALTIHQVKLSSSDVASKLVRQIPL